MYLFAKLKPFEQKEHFSLKEQNGLGMNQANVRKGPDGQGDRTVIYYYVLYITPRYTLHCITVIVL